uniref:C-type lectin domain-containing protein n=1 Tax=Sinocyclocheilus rhinocerous TaxID=307959 RepID=A0A673KEX6_9TELE
MKDELVNANNEITKLNHQLTEEEKLLSKHLREMGNLELYTKTTQIFIIKKDINKRLATNMVVLPDGWTCYQSSLYYISSEEKNWNDSYQDCLKRGANLTIINRNKEEDFLKTYGEVWIGLTNMEGTWKWVDGSTLTSSFWASGEPNGHTKKDCAVTSKHSDKPEWNYYPCSSAFKWICEK